VIACVSQSSSDRLRIACSCRSASSISRDDSA
jgi:hypothetical protein